MSEMKYTQKSIEAMSGAQSLATERANQQLEQAHLLCALLSDEKGLIPQMLRKMGKDVAAVTADAADEGRVRLRRAPVPEPAGKS